MEGTCEKSCPFWKKYKEKCPFYLKTTWQNSEEAGKVSVVEDCAPKRSVYMLMSFESRMIGVQQDLDKTGKAYEKFAGSLISALELATKEPGKIQLTVPIEVKGIDRSNR